MSDTEEKRYSAKQITYNLSNASIAWRLVEGPGSKTMPCSGAVINRPLFIAGVGLQHMACCDAVHLVPGWADDPRCGVEYRASVAFRLEEV